MINLPIEVTRLLGEQIALANNAAFLWRKLSESPTVTGLAYHENTAVLLDSLRELMAKPELTEDETTAAYVLIVTLLMKDPKNGALLVTLPGPGRLYGAISRLYWAEPLISFVQRQTLGASVVSQPQVTPIGGPPHPSLPFNETTASSTQTFRPPVQLPTTASSTDLLIVPGGE